MFDGTYVFEDWDLIVVFEYEGTVELNGGGAGHDMENSQVFQLPSGPSKLT